MIIDLRKSVKFEAMISLFKTIFVCIVLGLGAMMFSSDANSIALHPIEKMIIKVNQIAANPMISIALE